VQGGLNALPALGHRLVRQANDMHVHLAGPDHDLHFDRNALYALECNLGRKKE
jgi:hypothetical protein